MTTPSRRINRWTLLLVLLILAPAMPATATQHLIRAGDDWELFQARLKPGDEIILMSGRHRPAQFRDLLGTAERPIVIRGLDPDDPPIIEARRYGLRLDRPQHVLISNLIIQGASIHGIYLNGLSEDADPDDAESGGDTNVTEAATAAATTFGAVTLNNIVITDTGPEPNRHAVCVRNIDRIQINACRIEGWGGSGIELIASSEGRVRDCVFIGKDGYRQLSGVRIRAGSERIHIDGCRFRNTGDQSICIGAGSKVEEFSPPLNESARPGSQFEASRIRVRRCIFEGGHCAVAFVNCERSVVRNCTIVGPISAVLSLRVEQEDPRFGGISRCDFGSNIVTWKREDLTTLAHLVNGATIEGINLEQNLWWTPGGVTADEFGPLPGIPQFPQIVDVDPLLDDEFRPQANAAAIFGANAP